MANVKLFKLVSGEVMVAEVKEQTDKVLSVSNPLGVHTEMTQNGIGIAPYPCEVQFLSDDDVKVFDFNMEHVMYVVEPVNTVKNMWNKTFGSGLVTPDENKKLIV